MAVNNQLRKPAVQQNEQVVTYEANGMEVKLTPNMVRNYLVSGNKEAVTIQEVAMFMNMCKFSKLNPWVREAYCIKYGNEPATMVVGKEAFQKRAEANPNYDGSEAGIIVINANGDIEYRKGTLKLPDEIIVGGYAEVWRKDRSHSTRIEVSFEEYAGRKKDGTLNGQWSKKPATMIRKVALVQALRESFPSALGGMFAAEETGNVEPEYTMPIEVNQESVIEQKQEPASEPQAEKTESSVNAVSNTDARAALFGK